MPIVIAVAVNGTFGVSGSLESTLQRDRTVASYSQLMGHLKRADIQLNRKMLAQIAVMDPDSFSRIVELAKAA